MKIQKQQGAGGDLHKSFDRLCDYIIISMGCIDISNKLIDEHGSLCWQSQQYFLSILEEYIKKDRNDN